MVVPFNFSLARSCFIKSLLATVRATNKTILERKDLKGEGGDYLDQCEAKRRWNIYI